METNKNYIDQLFESARTEAPELSFEQTKDKFLQSTIALAGGDAVSNSIADLLTKKMWIMLSIITVIAISTGLLMHTSNKDNEVLAVDSHEAFTTQSEMPSKVKSIETISLVKSEQLTDNESIELSKANVDMINKLPLKNLSALAISKKMSGLEPKHPEIRAYKDRFKIDQSTTLSDLELIKMRANKAGLQFHYQALIEAKELKRLQYSIEMDDGALKTRNRVQIDFTKVGEPYVLGWSSNEAGIATSLGLPESDNVGETTAMTVKSGQRFPDQVGDEPPYTEKFKFNKHTPDAEFERIKAIALKDGITFKYERKMKGDILVELYVQMLIKMHNMNAEMSITSKYPQDDNEVVIFGWCEDDKGKFIQFRSGSEGENGEVVEHDQIKDESIFTERYVITQTTTDEELRVIFKKAEESGIVVDYKGAYKRKRLQYLQFEIKINEKGEPNCQRSETEMTIRENTVLTIMWALDENGKAYDFDQKMETKE